METTEYKSRKAMGLRSARTKKQDIPQIEQKTPENELMSVEEYFGKVWQRYLEKREAVQG